jgi:hypothetical protein
LKRFNRFDAGILTVIGTVADGGARDAKTICSSAGLKRERNPSARNNDLGVRWSERVWNNSPSALLLFVVGESSVPTKFQRNQEIIIESHTITITTSEFHQSTISPPFRNLLD